MANADDAVSARTRIALIGSGIFARNTYAPILSEPSFAGKVELAFVWSRGEESASAIHDLVAPWAPQCEKKFGEEGLQAILESNECDAVVVILPPKIGLEVTLRALRAGKHVLQEKPVGTSREAIEGAIRAYDDLGQWRPVWGVAENYRFEDVYRFARTRIAEDLGDVISISLNASLKLDESSPYYHTSWRHSASELPTVGGKSAGYLFEGPVHFMAAIRMLAGEVGSAGAGHRVSGSGTVHSAHKKLKQVDTLSGWLRFDDGNDRCCTASVTICYASAAPCVRFVVTCEKGFFEIERVAGKYVFTEGGSKERREFPFSGVKNEIEYWLEAVARQRGFASASGADGGSRLGRKVGFVDQQFPEISSAEALGDVDALLTLLGQ